MRATLLFATCLACTAPVAPHAGSTGTGTASSDPGGVRGGSSSSGSETSAPSTTSTTGSASSPSTPVELGPGMTWVRSERPFVSGLSVLLPDVPAAEVDQYFDDFHATAVHLWATGLPDEIEAWNAAAHPDFRWVSWTNDDGRNGITGEGVGEFPVTPGRIGYQVGDEPENIADVDALQVGVDRVRVEDPDALVILNFGNADDSISERDLYEYAIQTLAIDVISYDLYSSNHGEYERAKLIRDLGLQYGLPYWRYIDAYGDGSRDEPSTQDMRWAALLGLVYGFSGHSWFLYQTDPLTAESVYTVLFEGTGAWSFPPGERFWAAAALNQELEQYGRTINLLTSTDVRYVPETVLYMPDDHLPWEVGAGGDPWLIEVESVNVGLFETQEWSIGFFVDDAGEEYFMVQNAARERADFPLYRPRGDLRLVFDFATAPPNVDRTRLERLNPLTGAIEDLPLTWIGGTQAELVRTVEAGDVILLKYATGAPFAQMP